MVAQISILTRAQCAECGNSYIVIEPSVAAFEIMALLEEGAGLQAFDVVLLDHAQMPRCSNCASVLDVPSAEQVAEWKEWLRAFGESLIERSKIEETIV